MEQTRERGGRVPSPRFLRDIEDLSCFGLYATDSIRRLSESFWSIKSVGHYVTNIPIHKSDF